MDKHAARHDYWQENIAGWAGFYDRESEERLVGFAPWVWAYRRFLLPIERRYMRRRYELVCRFIDNEVPEGATVADIGCGSGVFTGRIAEKAGGVYALDFAQAALDLTAKTIPDTLRDRVSYALIDVTQEPIPRADVAIMIGVLPYIDGVSALRENVLSRTDRLLVSFLDESNALNRLRKKITLLDVRTYAYHSRDAVERAFDESGFDLTNLQQLATGWLATGVRRPNADSENRS